MDTSEHIETVFDYATKKELRELGLGKETKESYLTFYDAIQNSDSINAHLVRLGIIRNDSALAKKHLDMIKNTERKFWLTYQDCF